MTAIAHSTAVGDALDALRSIVDTVERADDCLLYTSPSPRD